MDGSSHSSSDAWPVEEENYEMIMVMGVTGAGKSYFINKITGTESSKEGHNLSPGTDTCAIIPTRVGRSKVVIIDTPGFDDPKKSNSEILTEISRMLSAQYQLGIHLKEIIYLHRISDVRFTGAAVHAMGIFTKICGEGALSNVLLVTTRWHEVDEALGASRERELRENFWAYMLAKGSQMNRFRGDKGSAMGIVSQLLGKANVVLEIQQELVVDNMALETTGAGSAVREEIAELKDQYRRDLVELEKLRKSLKETDRVIKKIERDVAGGKVKLDRAARDEERLKRKIANETFQEIQDDASKKRRKGFIPKVLDSLRMFVEGDLEVTDMITGWFSSS